MKTNFQKSHYVNSDVIIAIAQPLCIGLLKAGAYVTMKKLNVPDSQIRNIIQKLLYQTAYAVATQVSSTS